MDPKHGTPGTLVTTVRHGHGMRWQARWVAHDGVERSHSFARKAEAQHHVNAVTTAITGGTYADPLRSAVTFATVSEQWIGLQGCVASKDGGGYRDLLDVAVLPR